MVLAGKEYGSGSSRDWAAKGPRLLGVRAVLAESFERIHRSNLVGMGILPLQFLAEASAETQRPHRRRDLRHRRPDRCAGELRAGQDGEGARHQAGRSSDRIPTRRCASIRRRKCCTTSTAAFCSMCCASYRASRKRPRRSGEPTLRMADRPNSDLSSRAQARDLRFVGNR